MLEKRIILVQERISFIKTDEIKPWINYKERENLRNKQEAIEKKIKEFERSIETLSKNNCLDYYIKSKEIYGDIKNRILNILMVISGFLNEFLLNSLDMAVTKDFELSQLNEEFKEVHEFYPNILFDNSLDILFASYIPNRSLKEVQNQIHNLYKLTESYFEERNEYKYVKKIDNIFLFIIEISFSLSRMKIFCIYTL